MTESRSSSGASAHGDRPHLPFGLSISRTIITAHGGQLWAENNADRGATLHCLLPYGEAAGSLKP
jgi:two-component system sensor kinase FixL